MAGGWQEAGHMQGGRLGSRGLRAGRKQGSCVRGAAFIEHTAAVLYWPTII